MPDSQANKAIRSADKGAVEPETHGVDVEFGHAAVKTPRDGDEIFEITAVQYSEEEERAVLRKIDWNIIPLLCTVYMIQFADKTSLNYASLMGIREDANLDPNSQQYSWISSIFYAGYILWE